MSVSKGVDYYSYIDNTGLPAEVTTAFSGPKVGSTLSSANNYQSNNLQIDSANISGWDNFSGPFTFGASANGNTFATETNTISSLTGDLESGSMTVMLDTPPIVDATSGTITSYGFYDSGDGSSGLTNQDQCYVYCTRNLTTWMTDVVAAYPTVGTQSFYNFVLSGAHDSGMCTMQTVEAVLSSAEGTALEVAIAAVLPEVAAAIAIGLAPTVIMNAAMTQKDTVSNMLALGCRYFDFRPGTMYPAITGFSGRYHQHSVIPGMAYVDFLVGLQLWLQQNTGEIVVVSCNTQGFASSSMVPSPSDLVDDWNTAIATSGVSLSYGDSSSLGSSYNDLITNNTRVIFLNQIAGETTKYDSYTNAYATLSPSPIISALGAMNTSGQQGDTYTVLQLQGTASAAISKDGFVSSSLTASPLMSTKGYFDSSTLPWVAENAPNNLQADKLVVLLNDFTDNATADVAIAWTLQRMGVSGSYESAFRSGGMT